MSNSQEKSWSGGPNAPEIPYYLYFEEKASFSGLLVSSILYGMIVALFFQCMAALLNSDHRRGRPIKRGLVTYTVVMLSVATVQTAMNLNILSISYIDNRAFPGIEGVLSPGPWGYQLFISPEVLSIIPNVMFALSNWLADGLLLYRCYIIYSKNIWVVAFPCLMYLGSVAMGIVLVYQNAEVDGSTWSGLPYYSISISLDVLLTLMIVIRLALHTRNVRNAMGIAGIGGLSKAIITMLIESCAVYAVSSLLVLGPLGARNTAEAIFVPILTETQVIAPLLVIQRIANKSALTSNTIASGHLSSFKARSRADVTGGGGTLPSGDDYPMSSVDEPAVTSGELGAGAETTIDLHREEI